LYTDQYYVVCSLLLVVCEAHSNVFTVHNHPPLISELKISINNSTSTNNPRSDNHSTEEETSINTQEVTLTSLFGWPFNRQWSRPSCGCVTMRGVPTIWGRRWHSCLKQCVTSLPAVQGVESTSNRNEYREYFLGVKATGAYSLPYHLYVPIFLKSGSLNLLEPSGPVQACANIYLALPILT
jgi:hypothetical protein